MTQKSPNLPKQPNTITPIEWISRRKELPAMSNVTERSLKKRPEKHPQTLTIRSLMIRFAGEMFVTLWG